MTTRTDRLGRPWLPYPPRPHRPSGIAARARSIRQTTANPEDPARTAKSKIYWTAYRAGQAAKREAGMTCEGPWKNWRKKIARKRQCPPGEHKPPAKKEKTQGDLF
jgi:hypothetical protein